MINTFTANLLVVSLMVGLMSVGYSSKQSSSSPICSYPYYSLDQPNKMAKKSKYIAFTLTIILTDE